MKLNILLLFLYNISIIGLNINHLLHNDVKRMSLLSKIIYDYNYVDNDNNKPNYKINQNINLSKNITFEFTKKNNIYFSFAQFITCLDSKKFIVNYQEKYFNLINKYFPNIEIYGYFYNKKRLHTLILLNKIDKEIIVVFRGSQYFEEWCYNLKINEEKINFNDKYSIHNGIFHLYSNNNIDNNIIYILEKLFEYFPNYRKIFTGHSKGCINSILLSFELLTKLDKKYNYEIFGYGSPPLFNYNLASYLHNNNNLKIYNIVNDMDIISSLSFYDRHHIGTEILLKDNDIFIINHKFPYKIKNNINYKNFYLSIINHNLLIYIKNIFIK